MRKKSIDEKVKKEFQVDRDTEEQSLEEEVHQQIEEMKEIFKDSDHRKQLEEGTWFTKVLYKVLSDNNNLDALYFKKKYVGLDTDNIAKRLINNASTKTAIAGASAATVVTGMQFALVPTLGASAAIIGTTIMGEFAAITYIQIKLVHELSILYKAELNKDDPEDLLTIFWFTFGINKWEEASNAILKTSGKSAKYLGRKALRKFKLTKLLQSGAKKLGGQQLAKKITERGLLKLVVPGVNIGLAAGLNKLFTDKLGEQAVKTFKSRALIIEQLKRLEYFDRSFHLLTIPLIYFSGIEGVKKANRVIEMQNTSFKYLQTTESENEIIDQLVLIKFDEFCDLLTDITNDKVKITLAEIATLSHKMSKRKEQDNLEGILKSLDVEFVTY